MTRDGTAHLHGCPSSIDRRSAASLLALGLLAPILPAAALAREQAVDRLCGFPGVQTVLVNHAGELVAVRGNPERPHNIKSLSKSLLSAAAGIALADRTFGGLDQPGGCVAGDFEYNTDPRVRAGEQLLAPD